MRINFVVVALALVSGLAGAADRTVVQDGITVRQRLPFEALVPAEQVESQSRMQYSQLLNAAQEKHALLPDSDPRVQRVRAVAQRLISYAPRWKPEAQRWQWQVNVLNSGTVNAFCMPGGRIAFFSGILDKLQMTDDEIAAVMGHEMAHALREHSRYQQGKTAVTGMLAQGIGSLLGYRYNIDPNLTQQGAQIATKGLALKYSRDDEREADLIGLDIAARAGYDPRAGIVLWQKMGALSKSAPPALLSTHPLGPERIEKIQEHLPLLLPLYASAKGTTVDKLPPYATR
ncbi:M48 family metallopeptidase [Massilia sp. TS11]|uniref:M48 family metallopeptidase n=1 Tax=Massilia sp. TS11 TaxID=2908003 RepID=UPI001EDC8C4E|nr:M48 family metallopeptidase [Massilia sp. TS11]MCG2585495.1 M48 family metallopeptidase [Massilia sp. TS11]